MRVLHKRSAKSKKHADGALSAAAVQTRKEFCPYGHDNDAKDTGGAFGA